MENYDKSFEEYCKNKDYDYRKGVDDITLVQSTPKKPDIEQMIEYNFDEMKVREITVTFKPVVWCRLGTPTEIVKLLEYGIRKILFKSKTNPKIMLLHEISPLGMFHMHGFIQDIQPSKLVKIRSLLYKYGRYEIRYIKDYPKYIEYVLKDYKEDRKIKNDIFINIK